ncbi:MAG: SDR family oxidoreductase [Acidobacteriota bacterium]
MQPSRILVTGGAGYVGSALVPRLLELGHAVRVLDLFWYGRDVFPEVHDHPKLELIEGDIRDPDAVARAVGAGARDPVSAVIHLACISNDPSFELDPALGKGINLDAFPGLVEASLRAGVERFIYASSSSIYGVKEQLRVDEDAVPEPLTDYSRFKLECERLLLDATRDASMVPVIVRPATVCGYAPRLRLDLTVNILTAHALERGLIRVFGGRQLRPNLHIADMVAAYELFLRAPAVQIRGEAWNVGYQNHAVGVIAEKVRDTLGGDIDIRVEPSDDLRSYHIESSKIDRVLGFRPRRTLEDAILGLTRAHRQGLLVDALENPKFHNIRRMQEVLGAA